MNLKNDYKVLYAEAADGSRVFKASKTGVLTDAEEIASVEIGRYKLIYEKNGKIFGSESGYVKDGVCLDAFNKVFIDADNAQASNEPVVVDNDEPEAGEPDTTEPEVEDEEEPAEGENEIEG